MRRKLFLICVMVLLGTIAFAGVMTPERESLNFKIGLSKGNAEFEVEDSEEVGDPEATVDLTKSINIEYIASTASGFEYGLGIGFTEINTEGFAHDELSDIAFKTINGQDSDRKEVGAIYSIPMYVLARFKFDNEKDWDPYVFGNLGFSYVNEEIVDTHSNGEEDKLEIGGDFFVAVGVGAEYKDNLSVELIFSQTNMDVTTTGPSELAEGDLDVQLLTLAVGYRLDF